MVFRELEIADRLRKLQLLQLRERDSRAMKELASDERRLGAAIGA